MFWGLYKPQSNILLTTTRLITQKEEINTLLNRICMILNGLGYTSFDPKTKEGQIKGISIKMSPLSTFLLTLILDKKIDVKPIEEALKEQLPAIKTFGIIHQPKEKRNMLEGNYKLVYGDFFFHFIFNKHSYYLTYNSFFQLNYSTTLKMVDYILSLNIFDREKTLLDAYSGVGLFGIELARHVKEVYSIEIVKDAILANKRAVKENGLDNVITNVGDVVTWTEYSQKEFDIMLFDPPRVGLGEKITNFILDKKPEHVIYVSCEVETLVKDLKELAKGYNIVSVKGFDMFPHTAHVETVVLLTKKIIK